MSRLTLLCREAPPLTVAAVHVKTVLQPGSSVNEIVAASVVYLQRVRTDGPMAQVWGWTGPCHVEATSKASQDGAQHAVFCLAA